MAVVVDVINAHVGPDADVSSPILAANNFGDTLPGGVAGPLGLFVILLLVIATVLLVRNMNKRIKRLPASFDEQSGQDSREAEVESDISDVKAGKKDSEAR
ncbi:hypothetical protein [Fodinicola acaciae]|uniref:hypothetical protein n=1 Tax=Fodinicola acaciae TaxID=2681555 RepID=UPI0013D29504|nr:hypothetical protein [Fodinicola acaciae]